MKGVTVSPAISKWQQWQLANAAFVSAAWHCFFYSRAFFDFLFSKVSRPVGAMSVQPLPSDSDSAFIPFTYMFAKQGKQFGHMVTYDGFGCRSDVVSDVVQIRGFSKKQVYTVKMQTCRERRLNNFLVWLLLSLIV